eukprot:TCONS_00073419-protein
MKEDIIICTENRCVDDRDSDSLTCAKCKRSIHYRCCMLPAFHIQTLKANRTQKYICINCVEVEPKLLELVPRRKRLNHRFKRKMKLNASAEKSTHAKEL